MLIELITPRSLSPCHRREHSDAMRVAVKVDSNDCVGKLVQSTVYADKAFIGCLESTTRS